MATRLILAMVLYAGLAACDDGPTTPAGPSPADGTAEATQGSEPPTADGQTTTTEQRAEGSKPAAARATYGEPTAAPSDDGANHQGEVWTNPGSSVRNLSPGTIRTTWLRASPEPVMVGSWTQVESCSGSDCWTHEDTEPHNWEQVSSCAESPTWPDRRCWELTRNSGDGEVTVRFTRSGHTTIPRGAEPDPWVGVYHPNGHGSTISGNNCSGSGVATPVECTFTIPAAACEAPEMYYGWRLRARCRVAFVALMTRTGSGSSQQFYRHKVCLRTRAVFDGETVTGDFGTCR